MSKATIITTLIILSTFFMIARCDAGDFTVDKRSLLHVGVSGAFSFPCALLLKKQQTQNNLTDNQIIGTVGTLSLVPGGFKEVIIDAYIDWGDMGFNALGAYGGAWLGVKTGHYFFVSKKDNSATINYVVRY